ncbi:MAG TPA: restriction endonuclease subunit S [Zoogloea sp.]|nr:restriction endonuclease subunit S [Zoogloea sp.]
MGGDGWRTARLVDVAQINPDSIGRGWPHTQIHYVDISSVGEGQIQVPPQLLALADAPSRAKRLIRSGDTVLSTVRPNRRSMFFADQPGPDWVVSTGFAVLRPQVQMIAPRFLYACVFSQSFTEYLVSQEKGAAYPAVSPEDIGNAVIPLPPLKEQQAIACILGALDDKIELNRTMNRTLEATARAIFKSWFVDFDPVRAKAAGQQPPGLKPEIAALFPDSFEDSELGEIPKGWQVGKLGHIIQIHDSKRIPLSSRERAKRQGGYRYYGAAGIVDYVDDFLFDGIYILVGEDGSVVTDLGNPVVQYVWGKFWVNNHAHVLKASGGLSDEHLLLLLQQVYVVPFVTGAVQPKLSQTNMNAIPIVRATPDVNTAFNKIIEPTFTKIRTLQDEVALLAALRDTLLPKLISGELRIPDAERIAGRCL